MKDEDWPDWLRARQDLFPRDYLASYVALTTAPDKEAMPPGDVFELQLLLLSPGWLSSYEFSVSRSQKWGVTGSYSINMVPVSAVSHVEAKDSPVKWEEEAARVSTKQRSG